MVIGARAGTGARVFVEERTTVAFSTVGVEPTRDRFFIVSEHLCLVSTTSQYSSIFHYIFGSLYNLAV